MEPKIKKMAKNKNICFIFDNNDKSINSVEKDVLGILKQLQKYYQIKSPRINIELIYSRKELNNKFGGKTPRWLVAIAQHKNIFLLSPSIIERISNHKKMKLRKY